MYKILIKKPQLPKDTFTFYSETTSTVDDETSEVTKTTAIYETNNLSDLLLYFSFSNLHRRVALVYTILLHILRSHATHG